MLNNDLKDNSINNFSPFEEAKRGQGFTYKGKEFIHHSDLAPHHTAFRTINIKQKYWAAAIGTILLLAFLINWRATLFSLIALLTIVYFIDLVFNLFLIFRSFSKKPEISFSDEQISSLKDEDLPNYTIFCPLYHEWAVLPQFVNAINKLDYPKNKLQVILLLEEDDQQTILHAQNLELPEYFQITVVPHSLPKTKPKAMNYGLKIAEGDYITIYDAEDAPDPLQLKKAFLAFKTLGPEVACIQSKLNFYNPNQNFITKLFTAEYSLWFDLILPGMQSLNAPIPLGGTSNHFRAEDLRKLKGWDAFNVTEDCDLGIRLAKLGYRTAIIDSTTYEEANSQFKNWYRQRSRWIKGYMQTYLVHMRQPKELWEQEQNPKNLLIFQLLIGGKILSMMINPLLWLVTIIYFVFRAQAAPYIEPFFPGWILYLGVFSLVFGNFLYLYYYMIGLARRNYYGLIKYAFLVPFYWLGMSTAVWQALYEIIHKPHYWHKTVHGLHLDKSLSKDTSVQQNYNIPVPAQASFHPQVNLEVSSAEDIQTAESFAIGSGASGVFSFLDRAKAVFQKPKKFFQNSKLGSLTSGTTLVIAMMAGNFFNFFYNAYLGRTLAYETFGIVILFNTLLSFLTVFVGALSNTVTHRTAFLKGKYGSGAAGEFMIDARKKSFLAALVFSAIWLGFTPLLEHYFNVPSIIPFLFFTPVIIFSVIAYNERAYLQGNLFFSLVGIAIIAESGTKLLSAFLLVSFHKSNWAHLSIPISLAAAAVAAWISARRKFNKVADSPISQIPDKSFPLKFFSASLLAGLATSVFLNFDVFLVKHYFSASAAGEYSLLSLIGKMIYFLGSLLISFIVAIVGSQEGSNTNSKKTFYKIFGATAVLVMGSVVALGPLGSTIVPLLFGPKSLPILPYLTAYMLAMALFTLSTAILMYHLARKQYIFPAASVVLSSIMCFGIILRHRDILQVTHVVLFSSSMSLLVLAIMHLVENKIKFIKNNILDFIGIFSPEVPGVPKGGTFARRILIFNWRDTKHTFAGGAEVYIHELAKRWAMAGSDVTVFCGNDGQNTREEIIDGVHIVRRGGFYFVYFWAFLYYILRFRGKFDVIVDCQNGIPFFTPLYAQEKIYCLMHHVHQEVFRKHLPFPLSSFAAFLENTAMPFIYRKVKFITISDSSKSEMENLGLGIAGMEIVHPGVDLENLEPGEKFSQPLVLYLGRLKAYKSVDVLIRAFRQILKKLPTARLVIAGDGEERVKLEQLSKDLNLQDSVHFIGKISEKRKISLLKKAWVFCNPSMMEGWGITTIEANACGVPVVAADVPGLRDSVNNPHTGYLVEHGNHAKFAESILSILTNLPLRQFMKQHSLAWASNFDWDKSAKKSLEVIYER